MRKPPYIFHEMKPSEIANLLLLVGGINLQDFSNAQSTKPPLWKRIAFALKVIRWE